MKKLSIEQINELADIQKRFKAIYNELIGLQGMGSDCVQISFECFVNTFQMETSEYEDGTRENPYFFKTTNQGVKFLAIANAEQIVSISETHTDQFNKISEMVQMACD